MRPVGAAAVAALLLASPAEANRSGITERAEMGCGGAGCHAGGTAPDVQFIGPSSVAPGGVAEFTLRVVGGQVAAGANIRANAGLLVPGTGLSARNGQLVHAGDALAYTDGAAEFTFEWEAPDSPGAVDLFAAANSVDNNFVPTGDMWALASTTVTVGGGTPDGGAPEPEPSPDAGGGGGGGDEGCAARPGPAGGGAILAALLIGGLAWRRSRAHGA